MKNRPSLASKSIATELANLMSGAYSNYSEMEKLLSRLECSPALNTAEPKAQATSPGRRSRSIGIWEPSSNQKPASYRRDPGREIEWPLWADVQEIKPKGNKKRIILFGESVARGFLYDPYYNVAKELEGCLLANQGFQNLEVADLAKVGIQMPELLHLIQSSVELEPDAFVIFAGNNWFFATSPGSLDFSSLMELYKKEGFPGIKSFLESQLEAIVKDFLNQVAQIAKSKKIPVVFVIPEFNLKDWKSAEIEKIPAWSVDGSIEKWLHTKDAIETLPEQSTDELKALAEQLIGFDRSNPLGYELLGEYYLEHNQLNEARKCFEEARDTALFARSNNSMPRCVAKISQTILEHAPVCGIRTVNLPQLFRDAFPNSIPDRQLFLDNCHLTVEGIKLAVRHITSVLIKITPGLMPRLGTAKASDIMPGNHVKSVAHFSAAIYNAHHGQPGDIISYHCNKAVSLSPAIKDTMLRYIDFSTRKTHSFLCKSFQDLMLTGEITQYECGFALGHPRNGKLFDFILIDAISDALDPAANDIDVKSSVRELRMQEHLTGMEKVNLLESHYWKHSYIDFAAMTSSDYVQLRSNNNSFYFISEESTPLSFQLTYRTPGGNHTDRLIKIFLNDFPQHIAEFPMSGTWKNVGFTIDRKLLVNGVNKFTFKWPYVSRPMNIPGPLTSSSFLRSLFPVFAEIYSFTMTIKTKATDKYEFQEAAIEQGIVS